MTDRDGVTLLQMGSGKGATVFHCAVGVTENWHGVPREVAKSPSLDILKIHLGIVLGSWL